MSRKLIAFLASELKVVRVVCKNSQCGAAYYADKDVNPLGALAKAIVEVQESNKKAEVEFVLEGEE